MPPVLFTLYGVSIPPNHGFRTLMMLGFDPAESCCRFLWRLGFDPTESWVSIPPSPGVSIPSEAGFRSHRVVGVDPYGCGVSIPQCGKAVAVVDPHELGFRSLTSLVSLLVSY